MMKFYILSTQAMNVVIKIAVAVFLLLGMSNFANAQSNIKPASVRAEDWQASGQDGIVALRLDGKVLNMMHVDGRRFLRQGFDGKRDDKRNVEASPSDQTPYLPSRSTLGFDWVLENVGDGYYHIINLTTGLYLTLDNDDNRNVSNWGRMPALDNHQKWRFVLSDAQAELYSGMAIKGSYGTFRIYNKVNNQPLTMHDFGTNSDEENVHVWPDPGPQAPGFDWVLMPARDTTKEAKVRAGNYAKGGVLKGFYSDSLISVRRLTIESVKAIKVSTGQDAATKVLFTGIDLAIDAGMGVATGGASAVAMTTAKVSAKVGGRALTKASLKAAAKAGTQKMAAKATKKALAKDYAKRVGKHYGKEVLAEDIPDPTADAFADLGTAALDAMSSEAMFNKFYGESPDDFYINVNGFSIYPHGGRAHLDIESQDTQIVNKSFVFDRFGGVVISLMEYDSISGDDGLGSTSWEPYWDNQEGVWYEFGEISALINGSGYLSAAEREMLPTISLAGKNPLDGVERYEEVLISQDDEGSLYEITYRIEPFVPAFRSTGNLDAPKVKKRMQAWAPRPALSADARTKSAAKLYGNCATRGSATSSAGGNAERIRMYNRGSKPIRIYWNSPKAVEGNHASQDKPIHIIAPGSSVEEWGAPHSSYIATDENGECVGIGMPAWPYVAFEFNFNPDLVVPGKHPRKVDPVAEAKAKAAAEAREVEARANSRAEKEVRDRLAAEDAIFAQARITNAKKFYGNCSVRGAYKSVERAGEEASGFRLFNMGSKTIYIYWINSQGQEVNWASQDAPIQTIAPGPTGVEEFGTSGYWYIAVDANGECVGIGNPVEAAGEVSFNPDLVVPGANPRKAAAPAQTGYTDDGSGYVDTNEYADDQSSMEDYIDPSGGAKASDYTPEATTSEGPGCEYLGQVSSPEGGNIVTVQFSNLTNGPIEVYWINAQGKPDNYQGTGGSVASIPAQSYQGIRTKIGHVFAAADENGTCLGAGQVEFDGDDFKFNPVQ